MDSPDRSVRDLAAHYDSADTSAEMTEATWVDEVTADPMVTTSLRLPKSLLDEVRREAERQRLKPTALVRRLVEAEMLRLRGGSPGETSLDEASTGETESGAAALAAMISRAAVEDASRAARGLVEEVRREVARMHGVALADAALLAVKMAPTDAEGEGIAEARAAATAIVAAAEDEAALLRADAQREVDNLARRRDAIADQLGSLREMLAPIARRAALGDATARNVRTS